MKNNPKLSIMKSVLFTKALLLISALFFSILTCNGQEDPSDQLVGKWTKLSNETTVTFVITSDNKWEVEFTGDDEVDVYGSYVISGTQITFNDEGGEYSSDVAGVYEFKVSGAALTYTTVDDPVYGRNILVEGSWSKAKEAE